MSDRHRRDLFGDALCRVMENQGVGVRELSRQIGVAHSAVNGWRTGRSEPAPATVFLIERLLASPPGTLSRHLGYYPVEVVDAVAPERHPALTDCIAASPLLSGRDKRILTMVANELLAPRHRARQGH